MKQLFLSFAVILAAAVSLTSCMDDKGPNTVYYTNIVTFQKNIPSYMVFEYQKINDSPLIELQARGQMDTKALPEGGRCLITYSYADKEQQGGSGIINLNMVQHCYTDTVESATDIPEVFSLPYVTSALQRSGTWLNLYCRTGYVEKFFGRKFDIRVDAATINDEYPQLYLSTSVAEGTEVGAATNTYVSVNIQPVWSLATCKGVDVHVYASGPTSESTFRFEKSDSSQQ